MTPLLRTILLLVFGISSTLSALGTGMDPQSAITQPATKAIRFGTLVDGTGAVLSNAVTAADPNNRRRGTLPGHAVRQTFDDLVKGRDTVLEFTRELIRRGKKD